MLQRFHKNKWMLNVRFSRYSPEKQQEQARALAKQIDWKRIQAIISYGQERKAQLVNSLIRCWLMCKIKDTGEIGDTPNELMMRLNDRLNDPYSARLREYFPQKIFWRVKKSDFTKCNLKY